MTDEAYFNELATTSGAYYIPYIERVMALSPATRVLEIGCGEGGNLEPFAERGCDVTGVDIVDGRIEQAQTFFAQDGVKGRFVCSNVLDCDSGFDGQFDIVLAHDVIEHIPDKPAFLHAAMRFLRPGGIAFFGFPAWYMPFGGHQQICRSRFCSHAPFLHLLPLPLYRCILESCGVKEKDVNGADEYSRNAHNGAKSSSVLPKKKDLPCSTASSGSSIPTTRPSSACVRACCGIGWDTYLMCATFSSLRPFICCANPDVELWRSFTALQGGQKQTLVML